jgi:mannose-6-phosphate isomerase-like protein (cupin superfamily)
MSKLIRLSDRDTESLNKIKSLGLGQSFSQPNSYDQRVVVKPWGYEFLVFENEHVAVWRLRIEKGHATSMHCHPNKKTALIVLNGQALCNTFYNRNYLYGVDGVTIEAGVFHSTQAISPGGCDIIEVETPPNKLDLVRLDDQYGRSGKGYEGLSEMKTIGLQKYNYFSFKKPDIGEAQHYNGDTFSVELRSIPEKRVFSDVFAVSKGEYYCPCQGRILDASGTAIANVGDVVEGPYVNIHEGAEIAAGSVILRFYQS